MTATSLQFERQRPHAGWGLYVLLLLAAINLPLAITESQWLPGAERLLYVVIWSLLAGVLLGRSKLPGELAWIIGVGVGFTISVHLVTGILPPVGVMLGDVWQGLGWLWSGLVHRDWVIPLPVFDGVVHMVAQTEVAIANLVEWYLDVQTGMGSEDITVLWLLTSFAVWVVCWYAAFELMRTQRALVALLPLGAAIVSNAAVTYIGAGYVHMFTALMLIILVYTNASRMERLWDRLGLDFSTELRRDTLIAGSAIATAVLILGLMAPYTTYNRAVFFFWDSYGPRMQAFYDRLDRAFAGRDPVPDAPPGAQAQIERGLMPHDVGLGSDPSDNLIMTVVISDPPPPPFEALEEMAAAEGIDPRRFVERRYWRQRTYDIYTGSGWDTSERNVTEMTAEEPWEIPAFPHTVVTQTFTLNEPRSNIVFGINAPIIVDQDYSVIHRGQDDLIGIILDETEYTVVSYAPQPETDDLMSAEDEYPEEIAARYLDLPEVPERVQDLALEIVTTAGAETRYEMARAIESYIRRYEYDLDLEPPPLDTDITEYFLFDVQRGYCDYSASAMVVMLRSLGVAARYASGFGMGRYDYAQEAWVVTGLNAHAWAEVYFPGLGWIEFEPTPTELPREFVGSRTPFDPPQLPQPPAQQVETRSFPLWAAAVALGLVVAFVIVWPVKYLRTKSEDPRALVWRTYDRLINQARWLNLEPRSGQTPQEYLTYLTDAIASRGGAADGAADEIRVIGQAYYKARYSSADVSDEEGYRVQGAWRRLRGRMVRLMFTRPPERSAAN
jgi:transglutaminase-like putative cysteine protease